MFYDIGNAFNDWDDPDLKRGIGVGIRWYSIAGEIRVEGGGQDLAVRLKYGEVDVHQPLDRTRSVVADANIGDSRIYAAKGQPDSSRPFLVGSKVTWDEGPGEAEVTVKLSAGDITIRLD